MIDYNFVHSMSLRAYKTMLYPETQTKVLLKPIKAKPLLVKPPEPKSTPKDLKVKVPIKRERLELPSLSQLL